MATISSQRQITLPKIFLDELGLNAYDRVKITLENKSIRLEPDTTSIEDVAGALLAKVPNNLRGVPFDQAKKVAIQKTVLKLAHD